MSTIANELLTLNSTKIAIKEAIINKGIDVGEEDSFASYAEKIDEIETGGGGGETIDTSKVHYEIGNSSISLYNGREITGFRDMSNYSLYPVIAEGDNTSIDIDWSESFEIGVRFKITDYPSSDSFQFLFGCGMNGTTYRFYTPSCYIGGSTHGLAIQLGASSNSWLITEDLDYLISLDTWYFVKIKFVKSTMLFTVDISLDLETFTNLYNTTLSSAPYYNSSAYLVFGGDCRQYNRSTNDCLIDIYNTYIKDNTDSVVWGCNSNTYEPVDTELAMFHEEYTYADSSYVSYTSILDSNIKRIEINNYNERSNTGVWNYPTQSNIALYYKDDEEGGWITVPTSDWTLTVEGSSGGNYFYQIEWEPNGYVYSISITYNGVYRVGGQINAYIGWYVHVAQVNPSNSKGQNEDLWMQVQVKPNAEDKIDFIDLYRKKNGNWNKIETGGGSNISIIDTVLENGLVSNTSDYQTATFNDVSDYETLVISFIYNGIKANVGFNCDVEDIGNGITIIVSVPNMNNKQFTFYLTKTSIATTYYSGSFVNITASILGIKKGSALTEVEYYDYALFNGTDYIKLNSTVNSDYQIKCIFDIPTYIHNMGVFGTDANQSNYLHLTQWNNVWYASTGSSEQQFSKSLTGKHTFINNINNANTFDGDTITTYTPTTKNDYYLTVGTSQGTQTNYLQGKIYEYTITSISTGNVIMNLVPAKIKVGGIIISEGLYDTIEKKIYSSSAITIGNDN